MRKSVSAFAAGFFFLGSGVALAGDDGDPRQGEQVDRICFGRDINNFKTIKGEDDAVLLEKGVNDWYKATLIGACSYRQLKWAQAVAIDQRPAGGCVTPGDTLIFSRSISGSFRSSDTTRCAISEIYEWDEDATADDEDADADEN